jgi:hypothetical protein
LDRNRGDPRESPTASPDPRGCLRVHLTRHRTPVFIRGSFASRHRCSMPRRPPASGCYPEIAVTSSPGHVEVTIEDPLPHRGSRWRMSSRAAASLRSATEVIGCRTTPAIRLSCVTHYITIRLRRLRSGSGDIRIRPMPSIFNDRGAYAGAHCRWHMAEPETRFRRRDRSLHQPARWCYRIQMAGDD